MLRRTLLRAQQRSQPLLRRPQFTRRYANEAPQPQTAQSKIERFNRRLPRFLHKYTNALATAPLSHITSFLLLHEITAIVPLLGLIATFHYTHWLPGYFAEGAWVLQGVERFGKYFRKKGWIRNEEAAEAEREVKEEAELSRKEKLLNTGRQVWQKRDRAWDIGEGGVRLVVECATAYAIVKMTLPLRIMLSVWGTPWFASRTVVPATRALRRLFGKKKPSSKAAGTGAVDAGAVPNIKPGKGKEG